VTELKRTTDFARGCGRHEQVLTPRFLMSDPRPAREITALDGHVAFDVEEEGAASRGAQAIEPRLVRAPARPA
jgi:hypothetical protein